MIIYHGNAVGTSAAQGNSAKQSPGRKHVGGGWIETSEHLFLSAF